MSLVPGLRGAWFAGASVLRDLAALNAREMLPWDYRGMAREFSGPGATIPPAAMARLDEIAELTAGPAPRWPALRAVDESGGDVRVPPTVLFFPGGRPTEMAGVTAQGRLRPETRTSTPGTKSSARTPVKPARSK